MELDTHILSLPKDVQRLIFDLLPLRVLASSQQVCTQWNNELLSSLKKMTINDSRINGEVFAKIVSKLSPVHFKHVKLGAEAFIWDLSPLFRITHLASLDIHSSPSLSSSAFVRAVSCLTSLKSIRVSRSLITPRQALPAIAKHLPQLIELTIEYLENNNIEAADLYHVTKLTNLSALTLECYNAPLDDNFVRAVCSTLTKLEELKLVATTCSESLSALSRLKMMTRLIIPQGYFAATTPSVLPPGLQQIEARFSDESVESLVSQCTSLTRFALKPPRDPDAKKLTDAAVISVTRLPHLTFLNLEFEVSDEALKSFRHLSNLRYLVISTKNTSGVIDKLQRDMPNLQYVNNIFVNREVDNSEPYVKYAAHYQCEHKKPISNLVSFSDKSIFVASVGKTIWIQGREDLAICKAKVMHMMVTNSNDYVLICDEFGQLATYNVDDEEFSNYGEPVSATLTCVALTDNQRMVLVGTTVPSMKLLNTLGIDKYTVSLKAADDEDTVKGPVMRIFIKADKLCAVGVVPHGIFTWNFENFEAVVDIAHVQKTSRTITASAYFRETDLIVLGDSDGLVTLSSSVSIEHTEKFDCGAPVIALSVHPKQPLIAIATETDIIILCPVGGKYQFAHSSLPIDSTAKCTTIEWARSGGALFAGYSNGTVVKLVKCEKNEVVEDEPNSEEKLSDGERLEKCGTVIYYTAEKYLKSVSKEPMLAGKLTGMILELGLIELEYIIKQESLIIERVKEALEVLEKELPNFSW